MLSRSEMNTSGEGSARLSLFIAQGTAEVLSICIQYVQHVCVCVSGMSVSAGNVYP